ncbi:hypothetical protein O9992_24370 [Vibrio lentus]|nr:hypothetical protein [Vibrio lentus]
MAASQQAQAQTQSQIDELYALGNQNASNIDTLFEVKLTVLMLVSTKLKL